ncbi:hypothetical protein Ancab_028657 [Ancistrocladus abbreviatus]
MPSEEPKSLKKEEVEDGEDDKCLGSIIREKTKKKPPSNSSSKSAAKVKKEENNSPQKKKPSSIASKPADVKKVEEPDFDSDDEKPISKKSITKDDKRQKKVKKGEKKRKNVEAEERNVKKRERKVYDLPGQKRDPPEERDPLRIFYETLYKQVPQSEMAAIWMMESGLLPVEEAKKVYNKKQKKNNLQRLGSPVKAPSSAKSTQSLTVKKKSLPSSPKSSVKKKMTELVVQVKKSKKGKKDESSEEDSGDEFVISKKVVRKQRAG